VDATLLCRTAGRREVDFYRHVRERPGRALPVPACHDASYEGDGGRLTLERLLTAQQVSLSRHDALVLAVDALASIHATFWGNVPLPWTAALPLAGTGRPDAGTQRARLERACWHEPRILSDEDALTIGDVIESGVIEALARPAHRTLAHADLHFDNILFRTRGAAVEAVVIDWQLYESGIGPCDVAHALVFGLEPQDRRAAEDVLVRRYHAGLVAAGVRAYSLEACIADYRLGIARNVLVLLGLSEHGMLTTSHADRALAAYRDMNGAAPGRA